MQVNCEDKSKSNAVSDSRSTNYTPKRLAR
jgi:hypothetical protein